MLEFVGDFIFKHSPWSNSIFADSAVRIGTTECDGAYDGITNDLRFYYDKLFMEGKVEEFQSEAFNEIVVGDGFCGFAIFDFLFGVFNETSTPQPSVATPVPSTEAPSFSPTDAWPTERPSFAPSTFPSKAPQSSPTWSPTQTPSFASTGIPSFSPTDGVGFPSFSPTNAEVDPIITTGPSKTPSFAPSFNPTSQL